MLIEASGRQRRWEKVATALKGGVSSSTSPKHMDLGRTPMAQATSHPQPLAATSPAPLPLGARVTW